MPYVSAVLALAGILALVISARTRSWVRRRIFVPWQPLVPFLVLLLVVSVLDAYVDHNLAPPRHHALGLYRVNGWLAWAEFAYSVVILVLIVRGQSLARRGEE